MADNQFFVMSDNANSHHAFPYWLEQREFNQFESGSEDKRGNPIIKLIQRDNDKKFSKQGLVCCLNGSEYDAERMIKSHLEQKGIECS